MAFGGPNQTATPNPVVDFTPQKDYLSFSGIINQYLNPVTYTGTATTLTPSDVLGGFINSNNAAGQTLTLPAASLLIPQIEGAQGPLPGIAPPTTGAGSSIRFFLKALGAGTATLAVGAGGTLVGGGGAATTNIKEFLLVVTSTDPSNPTYTVYSLGTSAF